MESENLVSGAGMTMVFSEEAVSQIIANDLSDEAFPSEGIMNLAAHFYEKAKERALFIILGRRDMAIEIGSHTIMVGDYGTGHYRYCTTSFRTNLQELRNYFQNTRKDGDVFSAKWFYREFDRMPKGMMEEDYHPMLYNHDNSMTEILDEVRYFVQAGTS